jgi:hypothetical protein
LPQQSDFQGLFLILVAKAPGLVWEVKRGRSGVPHLQRKTPWPYVNHYHFHIIDPDWGHITIKMSGHAPFGIQVMLNGHEWVERQARRQTISMNKEGNCFVGGSFQALDRLADTLCDEHAIGRLSKVCDRWVYSSCLCFALDLEEQRCSGFHYRYSVYQLEYSRNLLFVRGTALDAIFQGLIDHTRQHLDVPKLHTLFGYKKRPHLRQRKEPLRMVRALDRPACNLTVFNLETAVGRGGVCGCGGAGQGVTTRNSTTIPRSYNAAMRRHSRTIRLVAWITRKVNTWISIILRHFNILLNVRSGQLPFLGS